MSRLFKAVKRFAPKTKKLRIQLKDELGHLLAPSASAQAYRTFFSDLYQSPTVPPTPGFLTEDLDLSWAEWFSALAHTHRLKHCADLLASFIAPRASFQAGPIVWPEAWTDAFLALPPKPPKVPSHPKALRPISLPDPLSKSLGVILAQRLGPYTQQYLATLPQHAYLAQRSTASAIGKVMSHCHQIRQLLQSQKLNIHSSRDGQRNSDLVGGLILSVDLSRAFDSLPLWLLRQSLDQAGVPGSLRELILSFHAHVRFKVANSDVSVLAGRGIRQGCPLAPQLWAIASGCITQMIAARTSPDFSRQGLTLYADDNLGSWLIQDLPCLCRGLREAAVILDVLSECGFEASTEKSIFILELRGRKARQALSNVTCVLADGKSKELELVDGYFR